MRVLHRWNYSKTERRFYGRIYGDGIISDGTFIQTPFVESLEDGEVYFTDGTSLRLGLTGHLPSVLLLSLIPGDHYEQAE